MISDNVGVFTGIVGETSNERLSLSKVLCVDLHLGREGLIVVVIRLVDSSAPEALLRKTMLGLCATGKFLQTAMGVVVIKLVSCVCTWGYSVCLGD